MTRRMDAFRFCSHYQSFVWCSGGAGLSRKEPALLAGLPGGGEPDLSARHQQLVLKKKCPAIETIIQYKPGAGGGLMWMQLNQLPGDGLNIAGINLPHIVLQPMEGTVQYKTDDITPVYWFHYTPDALVVAESSPLRSFQDFVKAAKEQPERITLGGSGLNSANHAAHERLEAGLTADQVQDVLVAIAPIVGTARVMTAAGNIATRLSEPALADGAGDPRHDRSRPVGAVHRLQPRHQQQDRQKSPCEDLSKAGAPWANGSRALGGTHGTEQELGGQNRLGLSWCFAFPECRSARRGLPVAATSAATNTIN